MTKLAAWILAAMLSAEPRSPYRSTFESSAETMAKVATDSPLFGGADGPKKTASWFVSVMWFESRFDPKAKGDCSKRDKSGVCVSQPQSLCGFQVGISNVAFLGVKEQELLDNFETCTRSARKLMKVSIQICRTRPMDDWLGQYAAGGVECGRLQQDGSRAGLRESGHRVRKATWLFANVPEPRSSLTD